MKHIKLFEQFIKESDAGDWVIINPFKKKRFFSGIPNDWNLFSEKPKSPNTYNSKESAERVIKQFKNVVLRKQLKAVLYKDALKLYEEKPKGAPEFHHSDAPDAEGRFRDLSIKDLAAWLIKTRKKDVKKISGSLTQQVVFNRNEDPEYAEKMEKTRKEVYKQLGRKDLLDKMDESAINEFNTYSGEEVAQHIEDITPEESDIPDYFINKYIKPNDGWKLMAVDLKKLLKTDKDFAEYYKSGEIRYDDDEVNEWDLDQELVVYKGELLDGYSRASAMLKRGDRKASAFVLN
jgi:hypothetical protein